MFRVTQPGPVTDAVPAAEKSMMRTWLQTNQPAPVPGVTDSPGNHPQPRQPGRLASGHDLTDAPPGGDPFDPGRADMHSWNQQTRPAPFAELATVSGEGPLASSIACFQGRARVEVLDQQEAANPSLGPQLGPRDPGGNPSRPDFAPAPSGTGETFGTTPQRPGGLAYLPSAIGGQR